MHMNRISINPERGEMPRDFSTSSIAQRKVSRICVTFGERWFRDAISIADARKPEIFPQSAIPHRSLYSLFPNGSASALLTLVLLPAPPFFRAHIFAFSSIKSLSFLPLLHYICRHCCRKVTIPARRCVARDRRRDRFIHVKLDQYIKNLFIRFNSISLFFDNIIFHVRIMSIFILIFFIMKFFS